MPVLERSELEASPLADLHAIADQLGLDGFRRLRKADLIDAILGDAPAQDAAEPPRRPTTRPRRPTTATATPSGRSGTPAPAPRVALAASLSLRGARPRRRGDEAARTPPATSSDAERARGAADGAALARRGGARARRERRATADGRGGGAEDDERGRIAEGVVEVLGNGSAFLRVDPPEPSDDDVYISAAQVRRCELVSGDRVTGPVRTPRRSERYPSLVRIDTINGALGRHRRRRRPLRGPAGRVPERAPRARLQGPDARGDRVADADRPRLARGDRRRRARRQDRDAAAPARRARRGREGLEVSARAGRRAPGGDRASGRTGALAPPPRSSFAASADSQGQAVERAIDAARRVAARGGHALVLIDSLDGAQPARRAQGAGGRAQPARRRLADGDRDGRRSRSAARRP